MKTSEQGFTLIELMITVAVIAILATAALPTYQDHIRKSRRAEAQAFLMAVASRQQQFLVDTRAFAATLADVGIPIPGGVSAAYELTLTVPAAVAPSFTLTAVPKSSQASEPCGTLGINQIGSKSAAVSGCW